MVDRDYFKLALNQVQGAKTLIDEIAKEYIQLLKYSDSLERAALGIMSTVLKKLTAALGYLEEVRRHISCLPALDPATRTLLLAGYLNACKSSFMSHVTARAEYVDVQPETHGFGVGHMD
jgi:nucleolar GTP-binding protein